MRPLIFELHWWLSPAFEQNFLTDIYLIWKTYLGFAEFFSSLIYYWFEFLHRRSIYRHWDRCVCQTISIQVKIIKSIEPNCISRHLIPRSRPLLRKYFINLQIKFLISSGRLRILISLNNLLEFGSDIWSLFFWGQIHTIFIRIKIPIQNRSHLFRRSQL